MVWIATSTLTAGLLAMTAQTESLPLTRSAILKNVQENRMVSEDKIKEELNELIEQFMEHCPFFSVWKAGTIDRTMSEKFLVTFDSLVKSFPALIAAGAARVTDEQTRVVLAVNLYQECGEGDPQRTHYAIYRKFLSTAGIDLSSISENGFAAEWRNRLSSYLKEAPDPGEVLGALAAGEFLAQPALSRIYSVLKPHYPGADQEYFTKHLVLEEDHVREITTILAKEAENKGGWNEVLSGFKYGLSVWEAYFNHLTDFITTIQKSN
jgi:pyrroloquinoline quinone (PQQ) biosynthesis protein C